MSPPFADTTLPRSHNYTHSSTIMTLATFQNLLQTVITDATPMTLRLLSPITNYGISHSSSSQHCMVSLLDLHQSEASTLVSPVPWSPPGSPHLTLWSPLRSPPVTVLWACLVGLHLLWSPLQRHLSETTPCGLLLWSLLTTKV